MIVALAIVSIGFIIAAAVAYYYFGSTADLRKQLAEADKLPAELRTIIARQSGQITDQVMRISGLLAEDKAKAHRIDGLLSDLQAQREAWDRGEAASAVPAPSLRDRLKHATPKLGGPGMSRYPEQFGVDFTLGTYPTAAEEARMKRAQDGAGDQ